VVNLAKRVATFNAVYKRYRFITLAVYAAVLVASVLDVAYDGIGTRSIVRAPEDVRFTVFWGALLLLIGLELFGVGHSSFKHATEAHKTNAWVVPFGLRLCLFVSILLVSDLEYTRTLFLILVLYSYLGVSRWLSYALAAAGVVALLGLSVFNPVVMGITPPPQPNQVQPSQPPPNQVQPGQSQTGQSQTGQLQTGQPPLSQPRPTQPQFTQPQFTQPQRAQQDERQGQPSPQPQLLSQPRRLPRPAPPPINVGGLIDASIGSVIALFFTLLLARTMAQALQDQQTLKSLNDSLETSHTQLTHYANRVAELAAAEERNRLARDIHDSLGHHLAAINIQLAKAHAYRTRDSERADEAVRHAQHSVQDALKDVRESVSSLREMNDVFSLKTSLEALVTRMTHSELEIHLTQTGQSDAYNRLALMTLYRVVQEALTNVHKHARANLVTIQLEFSEACAHLILTDDGQGFDVAAWETSNAPSYGLRGLQERLSLVGGKLRVCSQPQHTCLEVTLPNSKLASQVTS
jgi:signal transduction histidine kinase